MPVTVVNGGDRTSEIEDAARAVQRRLKEITSRGLRKCIRGRARSGRIECHICEDTDLYGINYWVVVNGSKQSAQIVIHLCLNNIPQGDPSLLEDILMHEWAHSCCWDHGDGDGVPGNSGGQ